VVRIYAYNRKGLEILWEKVRRDHNTKEETLESIYKTYGKQQWEEKCAEFNFKYYN
jgi:hypothetical protein